MALGLTLEEAKSQMQAYVLQDGSQYYKMRELFKIIGAYGVTAGFHFIPTDTEKGDYIAEDAHLKSDMPIQGRPCILCVKSKTQTIADHMVFYDGKSVLDPQEDEPQSISNYRILEIYPITYFIDKGYEDEKPAAPPVMDEQDLQAVAKCLVENPSWDNLLCGKYGRILAKHFLSRPTPIYDKLIKDLKDAGVTIGPTVTNIEGMERINLRSHMAVEQVREYFWREHPQFDRNLLIKDYGRPTFPTDVRSAWVDYIYRMVEENKITQEMGDHITLADQPLQHTNVIEVILHKVQYTFNIPLDIVFDDILREEIDEQVYEEIKEKILNGFRFGALTHYEGDRTIEGEWKIVEE